MFDFVLAMLVVLFGGMFLGVVITTAIFYNGSLNIISFDEDTDMSLMSLDVIDGEKLSKRNFILLSVNRKNIGTHK